MDNRAFNSEKLKSKRLSPFAVKLTGIILVLIFLAYMLPIGTTSAATKFTVNHLDDPPDTNPGDGICDGAEDETVQYCTLRAAIEEANALAGTDTITFDTDSIPNGSTIALVTDLPAIEEDLIIQGPGAEYLAVDGMDNFEMFYVDPNVTFDLSSLTLTRGLANLGGALFTAPDSDTTIDNVRFIDNTSGEGTLYTRDGVVVINNSLFESNNAYTHGTLINVEGEVNVTNSLFKENANGTVYSYLNANTYLVNTTFNNNNSLEGRCKSIFADDSSVALNNVTLVNSTGGESVFCGISSQISYSNSILAGNQANLCYIVGTGSQSISGGHNILSDTSCDLELSDQVISYSNIFADVIENNLRDNGGETETYALLSNSQALDYGNPGGCLDYSSSTITDDQREEERPYPTEGRCDIGSYEYSPSYFKGNEIACGGTCSVGAAGRDCSFCPPVNITVQPNTLLDSSRIQVWEVPSSNYGNGFKIGNRVFDVNVFDPENRLVDNFSEPLKICIMPTEDDLSKAGNNYANLNMYHKHGDGAWSLISSKFEDGYVCADVNQFSYFGIGVPSSLPKTGFAPGTITNLSDLPQLTTEESYIDYPNITMEIPALDLELPVVGVPLTVNGWNVTWLDDKAGYLEGTAFPTWAGNTAITGHVWDANNQPGPFYGLDNLKYGDKVILHAWGKKHLYEVRKMLEVEPDNLDAIPHSEYDMLTLITCKDFDEDSGDYDLRYAVQAVLINVSE